MRLENIEFVLPAGCWPGGSKSSGGGLPLDRLHGTAFHQYKVEQLQCYDSVTLLICQLGLGPAVVKVISSLKKLNVDS
jgi:hypothetical protein